jgi:prepilin-type processing-associated H-X9-DG protein
MRKLVLLLLLGVTSFAFSQTPEKVVQRFADEFSRKDLDRAARLVQGGFINPAFRDQMLKEKDWPTISLSGLSTKVMGNSARVSYSISILQEKRGPKNEAVNLVKSGSTWLIVPPQKAPEDAMLPQLAYMFAHSHEVIQQAHAAAQSTLCLSNVKQICTGILIFENDSDDVLKATPSNWESKIWPYVKNKDIFTCPLDPKGTHSYTLNGNLAGVNAAKIDRPAETVLIYEGKRGVLNFRHNGRATVGFSDGHVKMLTPAQAKSLRWKA